MQTPCITSSETFTTALGIQLCRTVFFLSSRMPNRGLCTEELTTANIEMGGRCVALAALGHRSTCIDAVRLRVHSPSEHRELSLIDMISMGSHSRVVVFFAQRFTARVIFIDIGRCSIQLLPDQWARSQWSPRAVTGMQLRPQQDAMALKRPRECHCAITSQGGKRGEGSIKVLVRVVGRREKGRGPRRDPCNSDGTPVISSLSCRKSPLLILNPNAHRDRGCLTRETGGTEKGAGLRSVLCSWARYLVVSTPRSNVAPPDDGIECAMHCVRTCFSFSSQRFHFNSSRLSTRPARRDGGGIQAPSRQIIMLGALSSVPYSHLPLRPSRPSQINLATS
ncbi:hypothetical protein B0T13DRAFT_78866 [Neurospora crassa]|nr:hypothetical protein B0T13DRAFT_78866 [Neurospora crassa]